MTDARTPAGRQRDVVETLEAIKAACQFADAWIASISEKASEALARIAEIKTAAPPAVDLNELAQLLAAATPGPWTVNRSGLCHPSWVMYPDPEKAKIEHEGTVGALVWAADDCEQREDPYRDVRFRGGEADERLIVWLRNHADALVKAAAPEGND